MQTVIFLTGLVVVESFLVWREFLSRKRAIKDTILVGSSYTLIQIIREIL